MRRAGLDPETEKRRELSGIAAGICFLAVCIMILAGLVYYQPAFSVGLFIGAAIGFFAAALCAASGRGGRDEL